MRQNDTIDDDGSTYDAFARRETESVAERRRAPRGSWGRSAVVDDDADDLEPPRARVRRGGPRAPLLVLPLIGLAAGIGIAYVAQAAHLTQAGYEESTLATEQVQLRQTDQQLGDEIARLRDPARVDAAARQLGMQPPAHWSYVAAQPAPIAPAAGQGTTVTASGSEGTVEHIVDALLGTWSTGGGQGPSGADQASAGAAASNGSEGTAAAAQP